MAFDKTGFTTFGASKSGNAVSLYGYSTADAIADVNTAGYFNTLSDTLSQQLTQINFHLLIKPKGSLTATLLSL
jgi:hypothetical protein